MQASKVERIRPGSHGVDVDQASVRSSFSSEVATFIMLVETSATRLPTDVDDVHMICTIPHLGLSVEGGWVEG